MNKRVTHHQVDKYIAELEETLEREKKRADTWEKLYQERTNEAEKLKVVFDAALKLADTAHEIEFPSMPTKAIVGRVEMQGLVNALAAFPIL